MGDGIKRPQPDLSFDELYQQAQASAPVLESTGQSVLDRLKTQKPEMFEGVVFEVGPLKEPERALDKINSDYAGDPRQIKDLVRGRFVVDTPEQIVAIKQTILRELDIDSIKDKYAEPSASTGYRDINTKVALENGHIAEIQVQQRDMMRVNKPTHDLMEEIQEIDRRAEIENRTLTEEEIFKRDTLRNQAIELHNAAAHDGNLNTLVKPELREQFSYKGELDAKGSALGKVAETFGRLKNGGLIAGVAFGTLSSAFTYAAGGSTAEAAEALYEGAIPYGEMQINALRGDVQAMRRSGLTETTSNIGAAGGALAGAAIGTAVMPGVGTAVGVVVGGIGGGLASGEIAALVYDNFASIKGRALHVSNEAAGALNMAALKTASLWSWLKGPDTPNIDLTAAFNGLPNAMVDDMPPEVVSLIELKQSPDLFEKQFESLKEDGSLYQVAAYIENNPLPPEGEQTYENRLDPQKIYTASLSF